MDKQAYPTLVNTEASLLFPQQVLGLVDMLFGYAAMKNAIKVVGLEKDKFFSMLGSSRRLSAMLSPNSSRYRIFGFEFHQFPIKVTLGAAAINCFLGVAHSELRPVLNFLVQSAQLAVLGAVFVLCEGLSRVWERRAFRRISEKPEQVREIKQLAAEVEQKSTTLLRDLERKIDNVPDERYTGFLGGLRLQRDGRGAVRLRRMLANNVKVSSELNRRLRASC